MNDIYNHNDTLNGNNGLNTRHSVLLIELPIAPHQTTSMNEHASRIVAMTAVCTGGLWANLDAITLRFQWCRSIEGIGHFAQIDESVQTNALLDSFIARLPAR